MSFTQYLVINQPVSIFPGQVMKNLTEDQLRRRKSFVKELKNGVYECIKPFHFKAGEVVFLDSEQVKKVDLQILKEPKDIEIEKNPKILDNLTKQQLVTYADEKRLGVSLDMKMSRDKMLELIKAIPDENQTVPDQD